MRKLIILTFSVMLFLVSILAQASYAQVTFDDGVLDSEGVFGSGSNSSFFVVDFGGGLDTAPGPRDTYAFEYRWDDPSTTAADGFLDIAASSSLVIGTGNFGTEDEPNLFVNSFEFGDDADAPVFDDDNRFWSFFVETEDSRLVQGELPTFVPADFGISGVTLTDGAFVGFRVQVFDFTGTTPPISPALPLVAVPEPSGLFLLGFAVAIGNVRRRRAA